MPKGRPRAVWEDQVQRDLKRQEREVVAGYWRGKVPAWPWTNGRVSK